MNLKVFGILVPYNYQRLPLKEEIDFCFLTTKKAIKNKLGIKFGGNVSEQFASKTENKKMQIPFELVDNFMVSNANCLFVGEGIKVSIDGIRIDNGESLKSRMSRVQNFFVELLQADKVSDVILYVNTKYEDKSEPINVEIDHFCDKILELYNQNNNLTPAVKMIMKSS